MSVGRMVDTEDFGADAKPPFALVTLLACPFCGCANQHIITKPNSVYVQIECDNLGGCASKTAWWPSEELAIAAWNRRHANNDSTTPVRITDSTQPSSDK